MHIDHRHVTTIDLHDGKVHDITLRPDDRGYQLSIATRDGVLTLLLSSEDVRRLGRAMGPEGRTGSAEERMCETAGALNYEWSGTDWAVV